MQNGSCLSGNSVCMSGSETEKHTLYQCIILPVGLDASLCTSIQEKLDT